MARLRCAPIAVVLIVAACTPRGATSEATQRSPAIEAGGGANVLALPVDAAPPAAAAHGNARLVIQHVEARCFLGPGEERRFTVGYDLLLEAGDATDGGKPPRDLVFCSKELPDGGVAKPRLGIWRNCREDKSCTTSADAGTKQSVRCGKDDVWLDVVDGHTILHGSFGDREVAPYPMTIGPTLREKRVAEVDC